MEAGTAKTRRQRGVLAAVGQWWEESLKWRRRGGEAAYGEDVARERGLVSRSGVGGGGRGAEGDDGTEAGERGREESECVVYESGVWCRSGGRGR